MKKTLVILAAGMGSRFGGLKQIEPVGPNGEIIIEYSIYDAVKVGFNKIVFIIKEENLQEFKKIIGDKIESIVEVQYVFQKNENLESILCLPKNRIKPYGTAHAILCASKYLNEPFAMINADDFYGRDAFEKLYSSLDENSFTVIGYRICNTVSETGDVKRGIIHVSNSKLVNIEECVIHKENDKYFKTKLGETNSVEIPYDKYVSMNMFAFNNKLIEYLKTDVVDFLNDNINNLDKCEYLIPDVVDNMVQSKKVEVNVVETTAKWIGMTYKEDIDCVKKELKIKHVSGEYPKTLW